MITGASLVLLGGIAYGIFESQQILKEKEKKFQTMSIEDLGSYIVKHNQGEVKIDPLTTVKGVYFHDNVLEFPYYVTDNFLTKSVSNIFSMKKQKYEMQKSTLEEDCSKTALKIFLQKGGKMHYLYRLQKKDAKPQYLFDFNNTYELCKQWGFEVL